MEAKFLAHKYASRDKIGKTIIFFHNLHVNFQAETCIKQYIYIYIYIYTYIYIYKCVLMLTWLLVNVIIIDIEHYCHRFLTHF